MTGRTRKTGFSHREQCRQKQQDSDIWRRTGPGRGPETMWGLLFPPSAGWPRTCFVSRSQNFSLSPYPKSPQGEGHLKCAGYGPRPAWAVTPPNQVQILPSWPNDAATGMPPKQLRSETLDISCLSWAQTPASATGHHRVRQIWDQQAVNLDPLKLSRVTRHLLITDVPQVKLNMYWLLCPCSK